jgi:hypothetical protein
MVGAWAWFIELQMTTEQTEPTAQAKNSLPALPGKAVVGEKGIGGKRSKRGAGVARIVRDQKARRVGRERRGSSRVTRSAAKMGGSSGKSMRNGERA